MMLHTFMTWCFFYWLSWTSKTSLARLHEASHTVMQAVVVHRQHNQSFFGGIKDLYESFTNTKRYAIDRQNSVMLTPNSWCTVIYSIPHWRCAGRQLPFKDDFDSSTVEGPGLVVAPINPDRKESIVMGLSFVGDGEKFPKKARNIIVPSAPQVTAYQKGNDVFFRDKKHKTEKLRVFVPQQFVLDGRMSFYLDFDQYGEVVKNVFQPSTDKFKRFPMALRRPNDLKLLGPFMEYMTYIRGWKTTHFTDKEFLYELPTMKDKAEMATENLTNKIRGFGGDDKPRGKLKTGIAMVLYKDKNPSGQNDWLLDLELLTENHLKLNDELVGVMVAHGCFVNGYVEGRGRRVETVVFKYEPFRYRDDDPLFDVTVHALKIHLPKQTRFGRAPPLPKDFEQQALNEFVEKRRFRRKRQTNDEEREEFLDKWPDDKKPQ